VYFTGEQSSGRTPSALSLVVALVLVPHKAAQQATVSPVLASSLFDDRGSMLSPHLGWVFVLVFVSLVSGGRAIEMPECRDGAKIDVTNSSDLKAVLTAWTTPDAVPCKGVATIGLSGDFSGLGTFTIPEQMVLRLQGPASISCQGPDSGLTQLIVRGALEVLNLTFALGSPTSFTSVWTEYSRTTYRSVEASQVSDYGAVSMVRFEGPGAQGRFTRCNLVRDKLFSRTDTVFKCLGQKPYICNEEGWVVTRGPTLPGSLFFSGDASWMSLSVVMEDCTITDTSTAYVLPCIALRPQLEATVSIRRTSVEGFVRTLVLEGGHLGRSACRTFPCIKVCLLWLRSRRAVAPALFVPRLITGVNIDDCGFHYGGGSQSDQPMLDFGGGIKALALRNTSFSGVIPAGTVSFSVQSASVGLGRAPRLTVGPSCNFGRSAQASASPSRIARSKVLNQRRRYGSSEWSKVWRADRRVWGWGAALSSWLASVHRTGSANLTIQDCTFFNNAAVALRIEGPVDQVVLRRGAFRSNKGSEGAAVTLVGSMRHVQVERTEFEGNVAQTAGGAIYASGGADPGCEVPLQSSRAGRRRGGAGGEAPPGGRLPWAR
jgi:predicted outer membrane repeat protein